MSDRRRQLQEMIGDEPDDAFLHFALAMEHRKAGDLPDALAEFDRAIAADDAYVAAWFQKARTLAESGDRESAKEVYAGGIAVADRIGDRHAAGEMREALLLLG
ncbi:MAG: hypothetical protein BIFFINMI_00408 [Phycisphaerae bacterium]|nr:hypothetical protein [Phycisphaerae bacterium]